MSCDSQELGALRCIEKVSDAPLLGAGVTHQENFIFRGIALHLHHLERGSSQQVFKHHSNVNAMSLSWVEACFPHGCCDCSYKFGLHEGAELAVLEVGEEVCICQRLVQCHVMCEGHFQVCVTCLL